MQHVPDIALTIREDELPHLCPMCFGEGVQFSLGEFTIEKDSTPWSVAWYVQLLVEPGRPCHCTRRWCFPDRADGICIERWSSPRSYRPSDPSTQQRPIRADLPPPAVEPQSTREDVERALLVPSLGEAV